MQALIFYTVNLQEIKIFHLVHDKRIIVYYKFTFSCLLPIKLLYIIYNLLYYLHELERLFIQRSVEVKGIVTKYNCNNYKTYN